MPTRRILELTVLVVIGTHLAFGLPKLWAGKTLADTAPGSAMHTLAEITAVVF